MAKGKEYTDDHGNVYVEEFQKVCDAQDCGATIAMCKSKKSGKFSPFTIATGKTHWQTCPRAKDFRRTKTTK